MKLTFLIAFVAFAAASVVAAPADDKSATSASSECIPHRFSRYRAEHFVNIAETQGQGAAHDVSSMPPITNQMLKEAFENAATCLDYGTSCLPDYLNPPSSCCPGLTCVPIIIGVGGWCWVSVAALGSCKSCSYTNVVIHRIPCPRDGSHASAIVTASLCGNVQFV